MKIKTNITNGNIFGSIVSPYRIEISVGNGYVKIGPGSLSAYAKMKFYTGQSLNGLLCSVGNYCDINESCIIHVGGEHLKDDNLSIFFQESPLIKFNLNQSPSTKGPIYIGHGSVLSSRVEILSGAGIENRTLVAASSLVTGQHKEYSLIAGVPGKTIKTLKKDDFDWFLYDSETVINYFKTGEKIIKRKVSDIPELLFKRNINQHTKLASLDFYGVRINNNFIPVEKLKPLHLDYFNQNNNINSEIYISDEIFNDLM